MFLLSKIIYLINGNMVSSAIEKFYRDSKYYHKDLDSLMQAINIPEKKLHMSVVAHISKLNSNSQKVMPLQLYQSLNHLAYHINKHEYFEEAIMTYLLCIATVVRIPEKESELAGILISLCEPYVHKGDYRRALKLLKYAYLIYWKKKQVLFQADVIERMGDCCNNAKDFKSALSFYHKAYLIYEKNKKYGNMAQIRQTVAIILMKTGKARLVPEYLQKAESLATMENNYVLLFDILNQTADFYQLQDKLKYALETIKNNITVSNKLSTKSKGKLIHCLRRKAEICMLMGEYESANDDLYSALDLSRTEEEDDHALFCLLTYSQMLTHLGDFDGARECLNSVSDIQSKKPLSNEIMFKYLLTAHTVEKLSSKSKNFIYVKELESYAYNEEMSNLDRFELLFMLVDYSLQKNDMEGASGYLAIIKTMLADIQNPSMEALYLLKISRVYFFDTRPSGKNNTEKAMNARQKAKEIVKYSINPRVQFQVHHSLGRYYMKDNKRELAKEEYRAAIKIITDLAKKVPENFDAMNFYRHPDVYKVFADYMKSVETQEEKREAIEMIRALKLQELGLI